MVSRGRFRARGGCSGRAVCQAGGSSRLPQARPHAPRQGRPQPRRGRAQGLGAGFSWTIGGTILGGTLGGLGFLAAAPEHSRRQGRVPSSAVPGQARSRAGAKSRDAGGAGLQRSKVPEAVGSGFHSWDQLYGPWFCSSPDPEGKPSATLEITGWWPLRRSLQTAQESGPRQTGGEGAGRSR